MDDPSRAYHLNIHRMPIKSKLRPAHHKLPMSSPFENSTLYDRIRFPNLLTDVDPIIFIPGSTKFLRFNSKQYANVTYSMRVTWSALGKHQRKVNEISMVQRVRGKVLKNLREELREVSEQVDELTRAVTQPYNIKVFKMDGDADCVEPHDFDQDMMPPQTKTKKEIELI